MSKIKIKTVEINFSEGWTKSQWERKEKGYRYIGSLKDMNLEIALLSSREKGRAGCAKTDVTVTFEDGGTYEARIDVVHGMHGNVIGRHIKEMVEFYTGKYCPGHFTREKYLESLKEIPEIVKVYENISENYDLEQD